MFSAAKFSLFCLSLILVDIITAKSEFIDVNKPIIVLGRKEFGDRIAFTKELKRIPFLWPRKDIVNFNTESIGTRIGAIQISNQNSDSPAASIEIVEGGVGYHGVVMEFTTNKFKGYHYQIVVYTS